MAIASYVGATLYAANSNFEAWLARTNQLSDDMGANVISNGTGLTVNTVNTHVEAVWSANTIAVGTALRGGTAAASAALAISSNTTFAANVAITGDFVSSGAVTFDGGGDTFTLNNGGFVVNSPTITINGAPTIDNNLIVTGDLIVSGNIAGSIDTSIAELDTLTVTTSATFAGATIANLGTVTTADINGGTLDNVTIGGSVAGSGTFSSLVATTADINGGTVDGATIGASSAAAGTFTTLTSGNITTSGNIIRSGDADTYITWSTNTINLYAGGATRLSANASGIQIGAGNRIVEVLNDNTMATANSTTLATSSSIKAYVDAIDVSNTVNSIVIGKHTIHVPAAAMVPQDTSGATFNITEKTTNDVMIATYDFNQSANNFVQFMTQMPNSWDGDDFDCTLIWSCASGTNGTTVQFDLDARFLIDNELIDGSWTSLGTFTDSKVGSGDVHTTDMTTSGVTAAANDWVIFRLKRVATADTLAADAQVIGITLKYNTTAAIDD